MLVLQSISIRCFATLFSEHKELSLSLFAAATYSTKIFASAVSIHQFHSRPKYITGNSPTHRLLDSNMPATAAVHALPVEIMTDIFHYALASKRHKRNTDAWIQECNDPRDIARLSHVCSRWRDILHCTSRLWTSLRVVWSDAFTQWSSTRQHLKQRMINHALSHSKELPVDLDMHADSLPSSDAALAVLHSIIPYASRLRNLRLFMTLPRDTTVHSLLSTIHPQTQFPLLEHLHLRIWTQDGEKAIYPPTFIHTPKLTSLTLEHGFARVVISRDAFQWSQIRQLNIQGMLSPSEYHLLLRQCSNLVSANMTVYARANGYGHPSESSIPPLSHPTLTHLNLRISNCNANPLIGPTLFSSLTFPALRTFTCRKLCDPDMYTPLCSFTEMVQRSRCPLEALNVDFDDISDVQNITELAGCTKDLASLNISFTCPITKAPHPSNPQTTVRYPDINVLPNTIAQKSNMWPKLNALKLSGAMDPAVVLALLERRVSSLRQVDLEMGWDEEVVRRIEELSVDGSIAASFDELEEVFEEELFEME